MSDKATERQLEYIKTLGGKPKRGLTKEGASELISQLVDNQPPTSQQIKFIKMLGGHVPPTKREASSLCDMLTTTASATNQQRKQALELGIVLPEDAKFAETNQMLVDAENDSDPEDGGPPTKVQIKKIVKLGGDPHQARNKWRADEYIEQLEEERERQEGRIADALSLYNDYTRDIMVVKRPPKKIMAQALAYGDKQGWGAGWENAEMDTKYNPYSSMNVAIYAVAPDLLKDGEEPPKRFLSESLQSKGKGKGCLVAAAVVMFAPWVIWWLCA